MRFLAVLLSWVVTTVLVALTVPAAWAQWNLVDGRGYAALAERAAADPDLQSAVAAELTTQALRLIRGRGHSSAAQADPERVAAVAAAFTAGPSFPAVFAQANRAVHEWFFGGGSGGGGGEGAQPWVLDLAPMLNDSAFRDLLNSFEVRVPSKVTIPVTAGGSAPTALRPGTLQPVATWGWPAVIGLGLLACGSASLTLLMARRRGRTLAALGVSALLVGAGGWAGIEVARGYLNAVLNRTVGDVRRIADAMVGCAVDSMHQWLNAVLIGGGTLAVCGVVVAMAGAVWRS